ncbi:hypothetical protein A2U01_0035290, partial [Trifolium medium]|nr:hypothetical protein [Trifolium medium]
TNIASSSTNPIISLSPPDFLLVDIQGIVHAPANVDVANCSFNTIDDETLDLMDFGNESDLGFVENLPCVEGDDELAENPKKVGDENKHHTLEIAKRNGVT